MNGLPERDGAGAVLRTEAGSGTRPEAASAEAGETRSGAGEPAAEGLTLRLAMQLDRVEVQLERLLAGADASGEQVRALARHLTATGRATEAEERLAELLTRVESVQQSVEELTASVTRLGRVQFKANALLDGKAEETAQAVAVLQEIATRRDEVRQLRAAEEARRLAELRAQGRSELAAELLAIVDATERALESGAALLERQRVSGRRPAEPAGLWPGLRRLLLGESPARGGAAADAESSRALAAWLEGLLLGHERLLAVLAAEDIRPIEALDEAFDPRLHVAVATEPRDDVAPGTVVRVLRTGYRRGERPVRFAEVVVSRASHAAEKGEGGEDA